MKQKGTSLETALKNLHLKPERALQNSGCKGHLLVIWATGIRGPSSRVTAVKMENQEELKPGHSLAGLQIPVPVSQRAEHSTWKFTADPKSSS